MNPSTNQQPSKKSYKKPIVISAIIIAIIIGLGILTKVGAIPNYLGLDLLCSEEDTVYYGEFDNPDVYGNGRSGIYKPVIYLYSQQKQVTTVKINYKGKFTVTYPEYNDGWKVTAYPDGKIINSSDNQEYSYLFWEGIDSGAKYDLTTGFIVKGSDVAKFLQKSLATLGLTPKEYNEFIVYWLPKMIDNEYNLIHFASKAEYDDRTILDVSPKPDSVLRVFMVFKKLENDNQKITPQKLQSFDRNGFTVVEWGGTELTK